ncbi:MAG: class I SAM-dependent methyltransferase [Planctomycetota bacterium JB042]
MRAGKSSRTALGVARALLYVSRRPELAGLLPEGAADRTRALVFAASRAARVEFGWMDRRWYRALVGVNERLLVPGGMHHVALRKRFLDDRVRAALDDGATRLVVFGAGFDTLALRVAESRPDVTCFEVDHPATQAAKRKGLATLGEGPENLRLVPADFAETTMEEALAAELRADDAARTVFVAEGLLMYLSEADVRRLLRFVRTRSTPASRLLFTFVGRRPDGRPRAGPYERTMNVLLRLAGEPFRFGVEPEDLPRFLGSEGFELETVTRDSELATELLPDRSTAPDRFLDWEMYAAAVRRPD